MRRPNGITILSLILGWLTIGGFANAWVILTGQFSGMPPILGYIALAYGITTLFSCIGLWHMKEWGLIALRSWMIVCSIFMIAFSIWFSEIIFSGYLGLLGFLIFVGLIFWFLDKYVSSKFKTVT